MSRSISSASGELRAMGARVSLNRADSLVVMEAGGLFSVPDSGALHLAKNAVYDFLNEFETDFRITIRGVPACFLSGAEDHIEYAGGAKCRRIRQCAVCSLRGKCPGIPAAMSLTELFMRGLAPVRDVPRELCVEVTGSCNYRCRACFSHGKCAGPSAKAITGMLGQAARMGVRIARFTGGEPLLRSELPDFLACAREKGFFTILNTNATLLDSGRLDLIEENVDDVLVSLQGCDERTERSLCGTGELFRAKLLNIARLRGSSIPVLRLGTVISHVLLDNFKRYRDLVKFLRPGQWEFYRPMMGRDERDPAFDIGVRDIRRLLKLLDGAGLGGIELKIANPVPLCLFDAGEANRRFFGAAFDDGHTRLVLDARGFLKPSYCMDVRLGLNMASAWKKPFMRRLRSTDSLPPRCRACADAVRCMGGSRFAAYAATGDYFAPDPWMVEA